jgi:hypothetical protein
MQFAIPAPFLRRCLAQVLLLTSLLGCGSSQLPLTRAEEAQLARLGTALHATVGLAYDRRAVEGQRTDGAFTISVYQTVARSTDQVLCQRDSTALKTTAAGLFAALRPTLRFRANHNKVVVLFDAATQPRDGSSSEVCSRIIAARIHPTTMQFREQECL